MYPRTIIDSLSAVPNRDQLTHKDLHAHFSTGQSILLSGSGRDRSTGTAMVSRRILETSGTMSGAIWCVSSLSGATKKTCSINSWSGRRSTPIGYRRKQNWSITRLSSTLQGSLTTRNGLTMKLLPSTMATSRSPMRGKQLNASDIHENGNATLALPFSYCLFSVHGLLTTPTKSGSPSAPVMANKNGRSNTKSISSSGGAEHQPSS